ncbi:MAG: preprotein translocase subunit SecG [Petroclostridium sp.]|jgi:preprotein translocase subunit SecG|uniref:preprotein translocase subunit SecG n=1 Tax=Petroclostridium xylanilyticum TaxID=1792311 RepID=UPI000B9914B2|nr:preprotein translocase subunit SecG [Petroclostridium xylanilyticum]MBZ4646588.1 protein translocase, SecG subunit [Clostridia bacterium]MDK2811286.1 preprotein translocase subunit SecG [Petroclostridium sp.]
MTIFITIIHIIVAISLIAIVLLQSGKSAGLSGSIAGGAETFFGKNKGRTIDAILSKWTSVAAVVFIVTSLLLALLR